MYIIIIDFKFYGIQFILFIKFIFLEKILIKRFKINHDLIYIH